jgi:hypothetical protein
LNWLVKSAISFDQLPVQSLTIRTQVWTDGNGIPDVRLETDGLDVIIEVKLDGSLTYEQAEWYWKELRARNHPRQALVAMANGSYALHGSWFTQKATREARAATHCYRNVMNLISREASCGHWSTLWRITSEHALTKH